MWKPILLGILLSSLTHPFEIKGCTANYDVLIGHCIDSFSETSALPVMLCLWGVGEVLNSNHYVFIIILIQILKTPISTKSRSNML